MSNNNNYCFRLLFQRTLADHMDMFDKMGCGNQLFDSIQAAANIVLKSVHNGGAVYFCGNGGSAADSQHIATELVSRFYKERRAINAEALSVNTSSLTAIGNDYSFEKVFERQLEAKGKEGDTLVGISTSGKSPNVIRALEYANSHGMYTILMSGNKDLEIECNCIIRIPSADTPRIQEAHIFIGHLIAEYVESMIVGEKHG